jgi:hypothetical protein
MKRALQQSRPASMTRIFVERAIAVISPKNPNTGATCGPESPKANGSGGARIAHAKNATSHRSRCCDNHHSRAQQRPLARIVSFHFVSGVSATEAPQSAIPTPTIWSVRMRLASARNRLNSFPRKRASRAGALLRTTMPETSLLRLATLRRIQLY